jgi:hypothetical protein
MKAKPTNAQLALIADDEKKRAGKVIYNVNSILLRKYHTIDLGEYYNSLMGHVEPKFIAMFYGPPSAGKSVFTFQFANYFAKHHGKVLYNSHEERIKKTVRDRIELYNIKAPRLHFGDAIPFHQMMEKITRNRYRLVVIDSVQYMDFTFDQLQELSSTFKKRLLSVVMVSFGQNWGKPYKAEELLYASDIKGFFDMPADTAIVRFASRYKATQVKSELFRVSEEFIPQPLPNADLL